MDVIFDLAKNFLDVQYKDIPREVIETTRKEVLDTLGVALGGSSRPGIKELIDVVKEDGQTNGVKRPLGELDLEDKSSKPGGDQNAHSSRPS